MNGKRSSLHKSTLPSNSNLRGCAWTNLIYKLISRRRLINSLSEIVAVDPFSGVCVRTTPLCATTVVFTLPSLTIVASDEESHDPTHGTCFLGINVIPVSSVSVSDVSGLDT